MRAERAGQYILQKLTQELPPHFTYHNANHTLDVHNAALTIARAEGVNEAETDLLLAAAWYHDAGYLEGITDHEEVSCRITKQYLPEFGYNDKEIAIIRSMIRATRLPQAPQNHVEQILADADLDYLGRTDFAVISEKLYTELKHLGAVTNAEDWDKKQVKFLQEHQYFTKTSINTRQAQKELNLAEIKARLHLHEK
ncbi:HD domain-containing protein [Mucilaginibacter aquatilis]|uniref:HD domain-containing protein n=1 Tax=Mucilaginibacter aquatilis TaxID=1517760 RepID=A0A6I4ICX1_9SPHI|nr:HD domain-containing protein [Mucilaginibacter aquatilis]MVN93041.1 HD domain-containing protein [Mucilaginibacter aquatilis]